MSKGEEAALTLGKIAEMYGLKPANLATIRARDPRFPRPVGRQSRAFVYRLTDVNRWARSLNLRPASEIDMTDSWEGISQLPDKNTAALAALGVVCPPGSRSDLDPAQVLFQLLAPSSPWTKQVERAAIAPILKRAETALTSEETDLFRAQRDNGDHGQEMDTAIGALSRDEGGRMLASASSPALVSWMLAASGHISGVVIDPACGLGLLLATAAGTPHANVERLIGIDTDPHALRIAALRLLGHGQHAEFIDGDSLDDSGPTRSLDGASDLVISDVPAGLNPEWSNATTIFGRPPRNEQAYRWLARAYQLLKPGGRAVLCTPASTLNAPGRAAKFRQQLLKQGAVAAVITLPQGMRPGSAPDLAIWILEKRTQPQPRDVLSINGARLDQPKLPGAGPAELASNLERLLLITATNTSDGSDPLMRTGADPVAYRLIRTSEQSEISQENQTSQQDHAGIDLTPWSPLSRPLIRPTPQRMDADSPVSMLGVTPDGTRFRNDLLTTLSTLEDQIRQLRDFLYNRLDKPNDQPVTTTLDELFRTGQVILFIAEGADPHTARTFHLFIWPHQSTGTKRISQPNVPPTTAQNTDVIVATTARSGEVISWIHANQPRHAFNDVEYLLRIATPNDLLTPQVLANSINALSANRWPMTSRGPLDLRSAATLVIVPLDVNSQRGLTETLTLRQTLTDTARILPALQVWS